MKTRRKQTRKAKISAIINAVYSSFEGLDLTEITVLAHDTVYDITQGKQNRNTQYMNDLEIEQFLKKVDDYLSNNFGYDYTQLERFTRKLQSIIAY